MQLNLIVKLGEPPQVFLSCPQNTMLDGGEWKFVWVPLHINPAMIAFSWETAYAASPGFVH